MSKWPYLALAIFSEVIATSSLKSTEGFTNFLPSVIVMIGYCAAFYFLSLTLDEIPGGPIRDSDGNPQDYDIRAQTRAVIENIKTILEDSGTSLDKVVDCLLVLVDMDRDFAGYNEVYAEYFSEIQCARTTVAVRALPTPIAVELKVIAKI